MRPSNRRHVPPFDAGMIKAQLRQSSDGAYGITIYEAFMEAMRGRNISYPSFEEQQDANVLKAVQEAGAYWRQTTCSPDEIVHTYLQEFTGRASHAKFQNLCGRGKDQLRDTILKRRQGAQLILRGEVTTDVAGTASAGVDTAMEVERAFDYLRAILKAQTGDRSMTERGIVFCRGILGNVPAWVRCFATNNDNQTVQNHGKEAAESFRRHPHILRYLETTYNYNAEAVMSIR